MITMGIENNIKQYIKSYINTFHNLSYKQKNELYRMVLMNLIEDENKTSKGL